jgi:hypothetical protein
MSKVPESNETNPGDTIPRSTTPPDPENWDAVLQYTSDMPTTRSQAGVTSASKAAQKLARSKKTKTPAIPVRSTRSLRSLVGTTPEYEPGESQFKESSSAKHKESDHVPGGASKDLAPTEPTETEGSLRSRVETILANEPKGDRSVEVRSTTPAE